MKIEKALKYDELDSNENENKKKTKKTFSINVPFVVTLHGKSTYFPKMA